MKIRDSAEQPGGLVPSIDLYLIKNPVLLMSGFIATKSNFTVIRLLASCARFQHYESKLVGICVSLC